MIYSIAVAWPTRLCQAQIDHLARLQRPPTRVRWTTTQDCFRSWTTMPCTFMQSTCIFGLG